MNTSVIFSFIKVNGKIQFVKEKIRCIDVYTN